LGAAALRRALGRVAVFALLMVGFVPLFSSGAAQAQPADLSLTKTVSNATPNVGDTVTFTVTLTNLGPNAATNVTVQDLLPSGLTFVSATPSQGTYINSSGLWTVGTVTTTTPQTLQIQAKVVSPNAQTNTATISASDQPDPNLGNNSASATVTPQQADLVLAKLVSNPTPNVGDTITFTVTLSNSGPNTATNVQVTDSLPAGLQFVSATPSQGSYNNGSGLWTVGTVPNAATPTLQVQAKVVSPNAQTNTATISASDQFDPNTGNNSASATETPQQANQADLVLVKSVSNPTPNVGDTITFTVSLSNSGPNTATNVQVTDSLPAGLQFVSATPSQGTYINSSGLWTVGTVTTTTPQTLQIQAKVASPNAQTNTATISASDQPDPNLGNNSASATETPQQADLSVTKSVDNATPGTGTTIHYTIAVNNLGPSAATNVTVQDSLPAGMTFVSATPSQGTYTSGTGVWTLGTVTTSAAATLVITATVYSTGAVTNTASISHSDQFDPNTANNSASATTNATTTSPPGISKSFTPSSIPVNGAATLSFTIVNPNNAKTLTGVGFVDSLPAGLVIATPNGLTGSCGGGIISANAGGSSASLVGATLAANAFCTFSINVIATTTGNKVNITSQVTSNEGGNGNAATATLIVSGSASTTTTLTSSVNPSNVGQAVTFTAAVTSGAGTPSGAVTFRDGGTVIGTATLTSGTAAFTTSSLALGAHTITASYVGSVGYTPSTSAALTETVQIPADSVRLRALQLVVTRIEALSSGSAISGATSNAITDGFSDGGPLMTPSGNGLHFNFSAEPNAATTTRDADRFDPVQAARNSALRDSGLGGMSASGSSMNGLPASLRAFALLPSASSAGGESAFGRSTYAEPVPTKAPLRPAPPKEWLLWADVAGTGWNTDPSAGDIRGGQINALVGLSRKLTPDFLIGVLGGYENFDYTSQSLNGKLKGDGWTVGGYIGWRIGPAIHFDASVARSGIAYDGISGTAQGTFPGSRWLVSGGVTGIYQLSQLQIEPSARVYALWEHEDPFTDSLGTLQGENNFSSGRASSGVKVAYPWLWSGMMTVTPYVGVYADYYFSGANAALLPNNNLTPLLLPTEFVQGWSARVASGLSFNAAGGARVSVGGELGGIGSQNFTTWTVHGRASLPFSAR
jgi:uncharacterized repeat protein (TIGR01451 family)